MPTTPTQFSPYRINTPYIIYATQNWGKYNHHQYTPATIPRCRTNPFFLPHQPFYTTSSTIPHHLANSFSLLHHPFYTTLSTTFLFFINHFSLPYQHPPTTSPTLLFYPTNHFTLLHQPFPTTEIANLINTKYNCIQHFTHKTSRIQPSIHYKKHPSKLDKIFQKTTQIIKKYSYISTLSTRQCEYFSIFQTLIPTDLFANPQRR